MFNFLLVIKKNILERRLFLARFVILFYIVYKLFDLKDPPLSFDSSMIGFIGFLIIISGFLLRSWAAGIITKNQKLITVGPYSLWRHPLYIGSLLTAVGFCVILDDWALWLILIYFVIFIYSDKIRKEEKKLTSLFGKEWENYKKETNKFFPSKININKITSRWSFRQWLYNKEYNSLTAIALALIVIEFWEMAVK